MNLVNVTKMKAGFTQATDKHGREHLVVVVKGTYVLPDRADQKPALADEQVPPVMTDELTGEPGFSATKYELDFALRKPRCDVLLNGSAYAPGGKPAQRVTVGLQIGTVNKSFHVYGNRTYAAGLLYVSASAAEPFTQLPFNYNNAYGGVDRTLDDPAKHQWYAQNPAGVGYYPTAPASAVNGKPMANTEELGQTLVRAAGTFRPMAFGPLGRSWQPRIKWAGTYDKKWIDEHRPFLPPDFDERYFQAAPEDQQIDYPRGGEEVVLTNLTPQGRTSFRLPGVALPVSFFRRDGTATHAQAVVDTIIIEPDEKRFMLVWRTSLPLRRTIREMRETVVGRSVRYWQRMEARAQRVGDKERFASLAELAKSVRAEMIPTAIPPEEDEGEPGV